MGRPRKYATEEERLAAKRDKTMQYSRRRRGVYKREDAKKPGRRTRFDTGDGFVVSYETLDRIRLNTIILDIVANFKYVKDIKWKTIEKNTHKVVNDWLPTQDNWDPRNKIFIFDYPETESCYSGSVRSFNIQLYLRRLTEPLLNWQDTCSELEPLAELLKTEIKNTLDDEGIEMTKRRSNNQKKLPDDTGTVAAEP